MERISELVHELSLLAYFKSSTAGLAATPSHGQQQPGRQHPGSVRPVLDDHHHHHDIDHHTVIITVKAATNMEYLQKKGWSSQMAPKFLDIRDHEGNGIPDHHAVKISGRLEG